MTQFATLKLDGLEFYPVTSKGRGRGGIIECDLSLVEEPDPIAFMAGKFDKALGRPMPTDYELAAGYIRGYQS